MTALADEVLAMPAWYLTPGLITYYREPLLIAEGRMQYVWDETGKQYLDAFAGSSPYLSATVIPRLAEGPRRSGGSTRRRSISIPQLHSLVKLAEHMPRKWPVNRYFTIRAAKPANRHPVGSRLPAIPSDQLVTVTTEQAAMATDAWNQVQIKRDGGRSINAGLLLPLPLWTGVSEL